MGISVRGVLSAHVSRWSKARYSNQIQVPQQTAAQQTERIDIVDSEAVQPLPTAHIQTSTGMKCQSPCAAPSKPAGASAQCRDGTYSFSQSRRGTCSHHGGVAGGIDSAVDVLNRYCMCLYKYTLPNPHRIYNLNRTHNRIRLPWHYEEISILNPFSTLLREGSSGLRS